MSLIIISLITGYIGISIGSFFDTQIFLYLFGTIGILSPGLYVLEKLYKKL